jgi:hypothetical protein
VNTKLRSPEATGKFHFQDFDAWQSEYFWNDLRSRVRATQALHKSGYRGIRTETEAEKGVA